jgi:hypothetical protein
MAYGDIIPNDAFKSGSNYREKQGVETVDKAVVLKDASTKGSAAIDFTHNIRHLGALTGVHAYNKAGLYVGTAGDLCVLLSGQSNPVATGTADGNTANKLVDSSADFVAFKNSSGTHIQKRDIAVNTTDNTAAFIAAIDSATTLSLVDVANSSSDVFPDGNENYEIYRAVLFQNVPSGTFLPIQVDRVFTLGTTADDIIALY